MPPTLLLIMSLQKNQALANVEMMEMRLSIDFSVTHTHSLTKARFVWIRVLVTLVGTPLGQVGPSRTLKAPSLKKNSEK